MLAQGEKATFTEGPLMYELEVTHARVTDQCNDPMQLDWYYRQLNAG